MGGEERGVQGGGELGLKINGPRSRGAAW